MRFKWLTPCASGNTVRPQKQSLRPVLDALEPRVVLSANPVYAELTGASSPVNGIDVGTYTTPTFGDVDGDGDLDLVVGETNGQMFYFENTGTTTSPIFTQRTGAANPFNGIDVGSYSAPAFGDLDGDGDLDLVSGAQPGTLLYYRNTGTTSSPAFTAQTGAANPFNGADVGNFSIPTFGDIDGDGDLDLVSGDTIGKIHYFRNTGTSTSPAFAEQTLAANPFNGFDVGAAGSTTSLGDVDRDGDLDLVVGESSGVQFYFKNNGTSTSPAFSQQTGTANPFNGFDVGSFSAPALGDLNGDGGLDLVSGNSFGSLNYYRSGPGLTASPTSLNLGTTALGNAGTPQTFTVSGAALSSDIALTAPTGVEISKDSGASWHTSFTLTPTSGTVDDTTISARISATAPAGSVSGNISVSSTNATTKNVAVSGTVTSTSTVSIAASPAKVNEANRTMTYTFTRSGSTSTALSASFSVGGTATFGTDYTQSGADTFTTTSGSITFGIGNANAVLTLTSSPDGTLEGDETIILTVLDGTGVVADALNGVATTTIDDSAPVATFGQPSANITASNNITYTLTIADTNFDASSFDAMSDLSLVRTGTANGVLGISGSNNTYTVTVSGITGDGTLAVQLADQSISDLADNLNTPAVTSSTFTVDNTAPTATALVVQNPVISPNNATSIGLKDTATLASAITDETVVSWQLTITDISSTTVQTFSGTGSSVSEIWDGKDSMAEFVADGVYIATLTYIDAAGNIGSQRSVSIEVDNATPTLGALTTRYWTQGKSGFPGLMAISDLASPNLCAIVSTVRAPAGMTAMVNGNSVVFAGTPSVAGTYSGSVTIRDQGDNTVTQQFRIVIARPLRFAMKALPAYVTGSQYNQNLKAIAGVTGGTGPLQYTFTVASGTLPRGLTLNPTTGVLSGRPLMAQTAIIRVTVQDEAGAFEEKLFTLAVVGRYRV